MGNLNLRQKAGMAPTPSGRSGVRNDDAADLKYVVDLSDIKPEEIDPQEHLVKLVKMQKYYSEVEKQYFWGNERKNACEVDEEKRNENAKVDGEKGDTKVDMAQSELVDGIFTNPDETDDYYKENVQKLFPVTIRQNYQNEHENIEDILKVLDYYKDDIESALGKLEQDAYSPLFVSILSHRNNIFNYITSRHPFYLDQICGGLDIASCAVMYENHLIFNFIFQTGNDLKCVSSLFRIAMDMFWSEERLGIWFDHIKEHLKPDHIDHFRKIVPAEFDRLASRFPSLMAEVNEIENQMKQDAKDYGQA